MAKTESYTLGQDKKGIIWDLLMYIPTVAGLGGLGVMFWYQPNHALAYLVYFLACFFLYQGIHRVLGRLSLLPTAPVSLDISKFGVVLSLKNGSKVELIKDVRYFSDHAGKSFGLTGMDSGGAKRQYVIHKGQFVSDLEFNKAGSSLKIFA